MTDKVNVNHVLTTCGVASDRSTEILWVVVALKSKVSVPTPDSTIVSLPRRYRYRTRRYHCRNHLSFTSLPSPPVNVLSSALPTNVSPSDPPILAPWYCRMIAVGPPLVNRLGTPQSKDQLKRYVLSWYGNRAHPNLPPIQQSCHYLNSVGIEL